ncbi:MAG TPA: hypothetical protein VIV58_39590 [Kofleriaceae bacterium]
MKRLSLALVLVGGVATLGHADTKAEKTAKLSVTVPDGWKLNVKDLGLTGESKDKDVAVLAWPVDAGDAEAAQKKIEGEIYSAVASLKWDKPTPGKAHGMTSTYLSGTGHAVGGDVAIRAEVIGPGKAKKWLVVALAVKTDKLAAHKAEIQTVLDSVQAAK